MSKPKTKRTKAAVPSTAYLLVCLMEECAEVQKECAKALRFGLRTRYKGTHPESRLKGELNDLSAIWIMLEMAGLKVSFSEDDIVAKVARVKDTLEHAQEHGLIKP